MTPVLGVLAPHPAQFENIDRQLKKAAELYWQEYHARQPRYEIKNISFRHDLNWNRRLLSVQSVRDGNHFVWKATRVITFFAFGVV